MVCTPESWPHALSSDVPGTAAGILSSLGPEPEELSPIPGLYEAGESGYINSLLKPLAVYTSFLIFQYQFMEKTCLGECKYK